MFGVRLDPSLAIQLLIAAAVFTVCQAVWGLARHGGTKRAVNARLKLAQGGLALSDIVGELRKQRGLTHDGRHKLSWAAWASDLVIKSGIPYQPQRWLAIMVTLGAVGVLAAFVLTHNFFIAAAAGVAVALGPPYGYLKFKGSGRAKKLSEQLPHALEVIVRSLEAGHPVPTAIALVGKELPDPIGSEFGMAADEIAYGSTLELAVQHMSARCRHPDIDLFAATIRLQDRSGGNLVGLLRMSAHTIRERRKLRLKIAAATSEGRISALILTAAPFVVLGILEVIQPHFYGDVIHLKSIQYGLGGLGFWMFLGNLVMRKMIAMRI
ncbi:MAG TPA: type II secretion system F family protein [Caulobacteraceae bacterium]|nr:type II secretion system F family protein [Caulobacteraceae bacterium]